MRLKHLTYLSTALLIAVCVALAATLWWSVNAQRQPYALMQHYLTLSQTFSDKVSANVHGYLVSGDAVQHHQASQALVALHTQIGALPETLRQQLDAQLLELSDFVAADLLAAGKLSGDPYTLLLQAEREMASVLAQLADYAAASSAPAAGHYQQRISQASQQLLSLGHMRSRWATTSRAAMAEDLKRQWQQLHALEFESLPLLGVLVQASSHSTDFADLLGLESSQTQAQDQGIALKREWASLLARYPQEIERTQAQLSQRQALTVAVTEKLSAVHTSLAALEPQVRAVYEAIQKRVALIQGLLIVMLMSVALVLGAMQRMVSRVLAALLPALGTWAKGDFGASIQLRSPIQELGRIEQSCNQLRHYLLSLVGGMEQHASSVAQSSQVIAGTSENLHQGALLQQADTGQIRDALGALEGRIAHIAQAASQTAVSGQAATDAAKQGQQVVEHSLTGLHALVHQVRSSAHAVEQLALETGDIREVLTVIRSVAEQTNLLALNAAIEAARAGETGRGFAVVADEVRSLAQRTSGATEQIQQMINRLQKAAEHSVTAMRTQVEHAESTALTAEKAEGALDTVVLAIGEMAQRAEQIAQATAQQQSVARDIRAHSEQISIRADQTVEHIEHGRAQSLQLMQLGEQLKASVQSFQY